MNWADFADKHASGLGALVVAILAYNLLDNLIAVVLKSFGTAIAVVTGEPTTTNKGE